MSKSSVSISRQTQTSALAAGISYFSCCRPIAHPSRALWALWLGHRRGRSSLSSLWWCACDVWRECECEFWEKESNELMSFTDKYRSAYLWWDFPGTASTLAISSRMKIDEMIWNGDKNTRKLAHRPLSFHGSLKCRTHNFNARCHVHLMFDLYRDSLPYFTNFFFSFHFLYPTTR